MQMNGLRNFIDKIKPTFSEGGKLSWLSQTFGGFETFAFTPNKVTQRGSHVRDGHRFGARHALWHVEHWLPDF